MLGTLTLMAIALVAVYYIADMLLRSLKVDKLTDKHVFITGCDSGFGNLAARKMDALGLHVFAGCFTAEGAKLLSESCSSRLVTVMLDVRTTESIEAALQFVKERLPPETGLWALINNAGIAGLFAPMEMCTREDISEALNVNLLGVCDMTRHFLPLIRKSKGRIVNTSSVGGRIGFLPSPYTIAKYGIEGFSDVLRREVRHLGVKVSVVEPGSFLTTINEYGKVMASLQVAYDRSSADVQEAYGGTNLMNFVGGILNQFYKTGSPCLDPVADVYIHAITSRFPRIRYPVGTDAKFMYIPLSYLPDRVVDLVFKQII